MTAGRAAWRADLMPSLGPAERVLIGEAWATTNLARTHGYAPRGERPVGPVPHGDRHTTFAGGLTVRGFVAPMVVAGAVRGAVVRAYVERVLVPDRRRGDVVVMGDLGSHAVAGVREAVEGAGRRLLYLPPYRPDRNPIGNAPSRLKALLRAAAGRTVDGLGPAIGRLIDPFARSECRNYFRHCGYRKYATRARRLPYWVQPG